MTSEHTTSTTILPFPSSDGPTRILGDWKDIATIFRFATMFRGMTPALAEKTVRDVISGKDGADPMAHVLEEMGAALKALRAASAELAGVDRLHPTAF